MTGRWPRRFSSSATATYGCTSPNEPKVEMTIFFIRNGAAGGSGRARLTSGTTHKVTRARPLPPAALSPHRRHVARPHGSYFALVRFDAEGAVRFEAARDAFERLLGERDADAAAVRVGRARLPLAYDAGRAVRPVERFVVALERAREFFQK